MVNTTHGYYDDLYQMASILCSARDPRSLLHSIVEVVGKARGKTLAIDALHS